MQALQEFADFVENSNIRETEAKVSNESNHEAEAKITSDADGIKAVLPFWPRLYCKLSNDNDRRVREYAHKAHLKRKCIILKFGNSK